MTNERIEYRVIEAPGRADLEDQLAGYGLQGWRIEQLTTEIARGWKITRPFVHTVIVSRRLDPTRPA